MSALTANLAVAAAVLQTGVSLVLSMLGLVAWRRLGSPRLFWVALAFLALTVQGGHLAFQAYRHRGTIAEAGLTDLLPMMVLLNLVVVAALYLAAWKR